MLAKFSASNDTCGGVQAKFVATRLVQRAGLDVAPVSIVRSSGKHVLLGERFDRVKAVRG